MGTFYGIGKGFNSKTGFTSPSNPRSYYVEFIRPPFTVSGSQLVRNIVGGANDHPMPFGDEGTWFYAEDAASAVDTSSVVIVAGGVAADVLTAADSATCQLANFLSLSGKLPTLKGRVVSIANYSAQMSGKLPALKGRVVAIANYSSQISGKLPSLKGRVSAYTNPVASLSGRLPALMGRMEAIINPTMLISGRLPSLRGIAYAMVASVADTYATVSMNTVNGAHTDYEGYDFNSMAYAHGKVYMAGDGGLFYESDAKDEIIAWRIKTGEVDSHKGTETIPAVIKREFDIYHDFVTDDNAEVMTCLVTGDYDGEYTYPAYSAEYDDKVNIGKGFNSRWYAFEMKNSTATAMHGSNIRLLANQTTRKR